MRHLFIVLPITLESLDAIDTRRHLRQNEDELPFDEICRDSGNAEHVRHQGVGYSALGARMSKGIFGSLCPGCF